MDYKNLATGEQSSGIGRWTTRTWPTGIQSLGRGDELQEPCQLVYRAQVEKYELQEPGQLVYRAQVEEDELQEPGQLVYRAQAEED